MLAYIIIGYIILGVLTSLAVIYTYTEEGMLDPDMFIEIVWAGVAWPLVWYGFIDEAIRDFVAWLRG